MAATKFSAIYVNNEGKIIEREIPGMNTYKIAEKFAKMLNDPEETKLVCVVESWKLYPKERESLKNITGYQIDFSNKGGMVMPLILEFTFEDGTKLNDKIPAQIWRSDEKKVSKTYYFDIRIS